ncbi:MAG TPA: TetR/AcrR family transcriptional regulator [Acidimicrobiales bacterium]
MTLAAGILSGTPSKGDRTRQSLMEAGIVRFAREGFRGTSVSDVCRDAGLSSTASYPYFPNKEALFVACVDDDVANLINESISMVMVDVEPLHWGRVMMRELINGMEQHPLACRIVSGLEPDFTIRLLDIPALAELRKAVTELIRTQQASGEVRPDIDARQTANGMVVIVISLLMATVQTGSAGFDAEADDVESVLSAATRPF